MSTQQYHQLAHNAAVRWGLDPKAFIAQGQQESGFNPHAISSAGAIGLYQLMPDTAKSLGVNPHDPIQNIEGAAKLMAQHLKTYGGNLAYALAAYNGGGGAVDYFKRHGGIFYNPQMPRIAWGNQTGEYVKNILTAAGHKTADFLTGAYKPKGR